MNTGEVLRVNVKLQEIHSVDAEDRKVIMILFGGDFKCPIGEGIILPGGVDTQKQSEDGIRTLSARYILEGHDTAGRQFHIFVENNGIDDGKPLFHTTPTIVTDAPELKWMEKEELAGTVEPAGDMQILIRIYRKKDLQHE